MSVNQANNDSDLRRMACLFIFAFIVIASILLVSINFGDLLFLIPLIFLGIVLFRFIYNFFWTDRRTCPRCDTKVGVYEEFCRNCGFKLIKKCPVCKNPIPYDVEECRKCGHKMKKIVIPENAEIKFEYQDIEETKTYETGSFCPNCGARLNPDQQNLRFCEMCGGRLR